MKILKAKAQSVKIGEFEVGPGKPCFVIAEAGVNHNGDVALAKKQIDAAKKAQATTVKFHASKTNEIFIKEAGLPKYVKENVGGKQSFYDLAEGFRLEDDELKELKEYCEKVGIMFSLTPYGQHGIKIMKDLNVDFFKIGSTHVDCTPLTKMIARTKKPIVLSSGMSTLKDIESAIQDIKEEGNDQIVLLHCTTNYPCPFEQVNLAVMKTFQEKFGLPIGYSDHTEGIVVPIMAVMLGAVLIEKHFTLDRNMKGPDHKASLESDELKTMMKAIRYFEKYRDKFSNLYEAVEKLKDKFQPKEIKDFSSKEIKKLVDLIIGDENKKLTASEATIKPQARTSIVSAVAIPKGTIITEEMLKYTRPGTGMSPRKYKELVGQKSSVNIPVDKLFNLKGGVISFVE
ncbi:N-acetylneuraminate synthase family protein [Patescibacteria group bacterium]